jgi:polysaccharide biosynthesis PFTS motif protein
MLVERTVKAETSEVPIRHPIPWVWHSLFLDSNFVIARIPSHILWKLSNYKKSLHSILKIARLIKVILFARSQVTNNFDSEGIQVWTSFSGEGMFSTDDPQKYTFGNWLKINPIFANTKLTFCSLDSKTQSSSTNIISQDFDFPSLKIAYNARLNLAKDLVRILTSGMFLAAKGKPEFLSLGWELANALLLETRSTDALPHYIFFSEGDGVIRPLWTYVAEKRNRDVTYLFFSNCDTPRIPGNASSNFQTFTCASWTNYWCIDEWQVSSLMSRTGLKRSKFKIMGHPWKSDLIIEFPIDPRAKIAVLDYEALNGLFGFGTIHDVGYYDNRKEIEFLSDLVLVASNLDVLVLHKPKRNIPNEKRTKEYSELLQNLELHPNYKRINSDVSPHRLIEKSNLVISLPLTSTALIAKNLGKETFFYDPIGKIDKNDETLRGIPLIQSRDSLEEIIRSVALN